uniref:Uncharacterized protein n=1 Tax=viral metagenome TaxID=1070528 RepID=A0A6M3X5I2_9ZZZZ
MSDDTIEIRRNGLVLLAPRRVPPDVEEEIAKLVNFCLRRRDGEGTRR